MSSSSVDESDMYEVNHRVPNTPEYHFLGHKIISDQITKEGLAVVCRELDRILAANIKGDVTEFGCYVGTTSLFIRRLLDSREASAHREFHVYDSFEGLPPKAPQDTSAAGVDFKAGKLRVGKKELLRQFHSANLAAPIVHKGWFNELGEKDVPEHIAFAFLDGDFYDSIISSLRLVWPRIGKGGTILIDDYKRETLPGVERAVRDFFQDKQIQSLRAEQNIAIIQL